MTEKGDHRNVDMLVKDIYGGPCTTLNLPAEVIASSFGRAARSARDSKGVALINCCDLFHIL